MAKKHGKQGDISNFRAQLDLLDLKIIQVTADGNCFFRALADQLEGNEEEHEKYRRMVVQYIEKNRELFEPFIEDDVPFDEYCQSMGKDGTWAGHMELQAATLVTHTNICIHRADDNLTASAQQPKSAGSQSKAKHLKYVVYEGALKMVMAGSGCDDAEKVEQVLLQVDGDVDAATEFLIAEQEAGETLKENGVCHEKDKIAAVASILMKKFIQLMPLIFNPNYFNGVISDNEVHARRGKRMKQRKKVIPITKAGSCGSNSNLPDMGALCI
uniref:OTU domain-containing protein n=1 Tax=Chenopodium quinoa TaxID=63459 RepID=A0A803KS94_CHEQI